MQLLLGCFGSVPPKALDGSFDVGHFMSDFILDVGHVICCCSAVSAADRQRLWKLIQLLIHSVGNVSALFMESCCYSAVVRVGCFLETSSRSVLRLHQKQRFGTFSSNVSALFQAAVLSCRLYSLQCIPKATIRHFCTLPPTPRCEGERAWKVVGFSGLQDSGKQAAGQKNCFYRLQR